MLQRGPQTPFVFDQVFLRRRQAALLRNFDQQDGDFGGLLDCTAYLTRADARAHRDLLAAIFATITWRPRVVDLGCGTGGYGLWLANNLEADPVGVDFSGVAIAEAAERARAAGAVWASFRQADFHDLPLSAAGADAIVSLDALYLAADRAAALAEVKRVLRPGGLLIFTVYEPAAGHNSPLAIQQRAWRREVTIAGLAIDTCRDMTAAWRNHMRRKHQKRWRQRSFLLERLGAWVKPELDVSSQMIGANGGAPFIDATERWEICARSRK